MGEATGASRARGVLKGKNREKKTADMGKADRRGRKIVSIQSLMEGIILQSIEDLWIAGEEDGCIDFFRGDGFGICADIAGINLHDRARLLNFTNQIICYYNPPGQTQRN